jgi:hypothetical protein
MLSILKARIENKSPSLRTKEEEEILRELNLVSRYLPNQVLNEHRSIVNKSERMSLASPAGNCPCCGR